MSVIEHTPPHTLHPDEKVELTKSEDLLPKDSGQPAPKLSEDDSKRLGSFFNQFVSIVVIATFTGGVQAAILSFMNDLLAVDSIKAQLFRPDPNDPTVAKYTYYSGGVMLGLVAIALNIGVAAIATVGATLACPVSASPHANAPAAFNRFCSTLEARVVLCMIVTFTAFFLSGISLMALSIEFDPSFTCFLAVLFFGGIVIAGYQPALRFGGGWFKALWGEKGWDRFFHVCSLITSAVAFMVSWARPRVPPFWYAVSVYGTTTLFHIIAVLYEAPTAKTQGSQPGPYTPQAQSPGIPRPSAAETVPPPPRRLAVFCAVILSLSWLGCALTTVVMKWRSMTFGREIDDILRDAITSLAVVEAVVLAGMAGRKVYLIRAFKSKRGASSGGEESGHRHSS